LEEDLSPRVANGKKFDDQFYERAARFSLYEDVKDNFNRKDAYNRPFVGTFLDLLMAEIPGTCMNYAGSNKNHF